MSICVDPSSPITPPNQLIEQSAFPLVRYGHCQYLQVSFHPVVTLKALSVISTSSCWFRILSFRFEGVSGGYRPRHWALWPVWPSLDFGPIWHQHWIFSIRTPMWHYELHPPGLQHSMLMIMIMISVRTCIRMARAQCDESLRTSCDEHSSAGHLSSRNRLLLENFRRHSCIITSMQTTANFYCNIHETTLLYTYCRTSLRAGTRDPTKQFPH